ncbi:MAG: nucleoside hydrolase [Chloroflexota bacterium]|nr:nucleoside hydrolase [Chloroflexota bacterium]|tara:strand:+ start:3978 stop:4904 length:927 start_codon:yes stop_codon:yes gene_type:complete
MPEPIKMIIDTDPGVDDAIAILMALAAPGVEILGLTSVGGNVPLARTTRNSLALLQAAGRSDIPVVKGASRPLRGKFTYSTRFHGPGGISSRLPEPTIRPVKRPAVQFLNEKLTSHKPGELVLVALGPLTNLAKLVQEYPCSLKRAKNIVVMGGAVNAPGNVTPKSEFNIYSDPVAAEVLFSSGVPLTLVDLAACRQVSIDRDRALGLRAEHRIGSLALRILQSWFRKHRDRERFEFYDPLAMMITLKPTITTVTKINLNVSLEENSSWGQTYESGGAGEITLPLHVDKSRFFRLLESLFQMEGLPVA